MKDQLGLCAYCMCCIEDRQDSAMNAHGSQHLPLHPLMDECESGFEYRLNGKIIGKTANARTTIEVLKLGDSHESNRSLIMQRKQHIEVYLMHVQGLELDNLEFDEDIRQWMLEELTSVENHCLPPFSPVIVNIIKQVL